ncbi:hypothetical protein [Haloquadratum walsbyi]|jgi:hypothetical protein|uniref:Uncharacterized protein n=1 Tax=Haloquadratum walsbyi J07HQW2 TaxID=1238425 RepID=U1PLB8_9EURY|nr:hypothetical protein [Haloquadratum walsbyi]ERG94487.1 MAG: hypothetical protein J07HQW2_00921 [Haloquadratum walsbyi J07HQW2]
MSDEQSDNIEEYLDSDLDSDLNSTRSGRDDKPLPGPFSLTQLVGGIHFLTAAAVTPFIWIAYRNGNIPQVASLTGLAIFIIIAGVAASRIAARRVD